VNGFVVPTGDRGALTEALGRLLASTPMRRQMGEESLAVVRRWGYDECREGFLAALTFLPGEVRCEDPSERRHEDLC
jgi:hypothetical protein